MSLLHYIQKVMTDVTKSDIMKHFFYTLLNPTKRKETEKESVEKLNAILKKLKSKYDFLKYIKLIDTTVMEIDEGEIVNIDPKINEISPTILGKAITDILIESNRPLDKNKAYFLMTEFRKNIGEYYVHALDLFGVDLDLLILELEVEKLELF